MTDSQILMAFVPLIVLYVLMLLALIPTIIGDIMLGVGIKRDADAIGAPKGTLFMLLTIFLGSIPAIVYACVRSSAAKAVTEENELMINAKKKCKTGVILTLIGEAIIILSLIGFGVIMLVCGDDFIRAIASA